MQNFPEDGIFQQWQFHYFLVLAFFPALFQGTRMKLSFKKNLSTFYCSFSCSILLVSSFFISQFSILIRLYRNTFFTFTSYFIDSHKANIWIWIHFLVWAETLILSIGLSEIGLLCDILGRIFSRPWYKSYSKSVKLKVGHGHLGNMAP